MSCKRLKRAEAQAFTDDTRFVVKYSKFNENIEYK